MRTLIVAVVVLVACGDDTATSSMCAWPNP